MKIRSLVQGALVLAAAVGIGAQMLPANACTSGNSVTWSSTKSCSGGGASGESTGLSSKRLRAHYLSGTTTVARGLNASNVQVCNATAIFENRFDIVQCPTTAVKHFVTAN
jgi:hypothetical protein